MACHEDIRFKLAMNLLSNPTIVRRLREQLAGQAEELDIWDVKSLRLIDDQTAELLNSISCGGEHAQACQGLENGDATTYITQPSNYRPFVSSRIEPNGIGAALYGQALELVHSAPLNAAVMASPLVAISVVAAAIAQNNAKGPDARTTHIFAGLDKVAAKIPKKGGEIHRLVHAYCSLYPHSAPKDCPAMVVRNFFSSAYAWTCIRSSDSRVYDLCAAMLIITIEVDFVGTADDGGVAVQVYKMAASDGLTGLGGATAQRVLKDTITACVFMNSKQSIMRTVEEVANQEKLISEMGGVITPKELYLARLWDGVILPWYRIVLNASSYRYLMNDNGVLKSMRSCTNIERCFYSIIRYNEIADLVSDYINNESLNECLVGITLGGEDAVRGYGAAVSSLIDDLLICDCKSVGHEEVAEFAMGYCLWMLLVPRYQIWKQLHALCNSEDEVSRAYAILPAERRLKSALKVVLPGPVLHAPNWRPLWKDSELAQDTMKPALIEELARRVVRRCLLGSLYASANHEACDALAKLLLCKCDAHDDMQTLIGLADCWVDLFEAGLKVSNFDVESHQALINSLRVLLRQLWQSLVTTDQQVADNTDRFYLEVDSVIRQTYTLPVTTGVVLRRTFFGVASSAIELCGFSPYTRLTDGVATMCSARRETGQASQENITAKVRP